MRLLLAFLICFCMSFPVFAGPTPAPAAMAPVATSSSVADLELPADQTVGFDEGYVSIQAKCKGDVRWLIVSEAKVKYLICPGNSIVVSVPPQGGQINVFAVGLVDGHMTDFVKTTITVSGGPAPSPNPTPTPNPNPTPNPAPNPPKSNSLHLTFLVDLNTVTPQLAQVLNSETLRKGITEKGNWFRLYDIHSDVVTKKKLDAAVKAVGGNAVLVIQDNSGVIKYKGVVPSTEQDIFNIIAQIGK